MKRKNNIKIEILAGNVKFVPTANFLTKFCWLLRQIRFAEPKRRTKLYSAHSTTLLLHAAKLYKISTDSAICGGAR